MTYISGYYGCNKIALECHEMLIINIYHGNFHCVSLNGTSAWVVCNYCEKHRHARRARVIFCEVSEIGAFMELFTVMIWLILEIVLVAMYSKR